MLNPDGRRKGYLFLAPLPPDFYKNMQRWRKEDRRKEKECMLKELSSLVCPRRSFIKILNEVLD